MEAFNEFFTRVGDFFVANGFNIIIAIVVFIIGYFAITYFCKLLIRIIYATPADKAVGGFFVAILRFVLWLGLIYLIASIFGISSNSFLVAFSSIALAVGLALKDSLANVANGIIILASKPFRKGDHVVINGQEGRVKKISIFTTELLTFNNQKTVLPNSTIVTNAVINYSANPMRRLDMSFSVSYNSDTAQVRKVIGQTIAANELVHKIPAPTIIFFSQNSSSLDYTIKVWVNTDDYWTAYDRLNDEMFNAFRAANIEIPYAQYDIHLKDVLPLANEAKELKNEKK